MTTMCKDKTQETLQKEELQLLTKSVNIFYFIKLLIFLLSFNKN